MILQRLAEFASRTDALPPMYQKTGIRWLIDIGLDGRLIGDGFVPLTSGEAKGKDRGKEFLAPHIVRTVKIAAKLLADNAEYVLGAGDDPKAVERHRSFCDLTKRCAEETGEPTVRAVHDFLLLYQDKGSLLPKKAEDGDSFTFRVDGSMPIDLTSVRAFWSRDTLSGGAVMQCLICGQVTQVEERLPVKIKGVPGGQTSGTAMISANSDAFESYGLSASLISPVCRACGEAFANSANFMIRSDQNHLRVGPTIYLFWTKEEVGFNPVMVLSQPTEEDVLRLMESYRTGQCAADVRADGFYALSLSASGGRVVVRDWLETTVATVETNLGRWFALQRLVDNDGAIGRAFGVYGLAASLYLKPNEQMVANVPRTMVRCALHGGPMPEALLNQAVIRNRAEQGVTRNRAALIKAVMLSQMNDFKEDYMEKLELSNTSPGYLCGRLLAELEAAQKVAIRPKATLVDRYYGAASSAPATVFGYLMRDFQVAHMSKLRKNRPGIYNAIDSRVQDILQVLGDFPKTLNVREQAMFSLGYYHQKASNRADARARAELKELEAEEATE